VTLTESTVPKVAELTGTRFGVDHYGVQEYGTCLAQKGGWFTEGGCHTYKEKKSVPVRKGKYELKTRPACFPFKHGRYTEGECRTEAAFKNGKYKGGDEKRDTAFHATSGVVTAHLPGSQLLECSKSSATGEMEHGQTGSEKITFEGCELEKPKKCQTQNCGTEKTKCSSTVEAGTIVSDKLEVTIYEGQGTEKGKYFTGLNGDPVAAGRLNNEEVFMEFACGGGPLVVTGEISGQRTGDIGTESLLSTTTIESQHGFQRLKLHEGRSNETGASVDLAATFEAKGNQAAQVDSSIKANDAAGG